MNYETMLKFSGWIDKVVGIGGIVMTVFYDWTQGNSIHLGLRACITIVVCALFIYKGIKQHELAE